MQACSNSRTSADLSFGEYLKQLRRAKGLTQMVLAEAAGISQSHLASIETGIRSEPNPESIRKLSAALGVTHIGLMIKAGYITLEEVLTCRKTHGIIQH